MNVSFEKVKRCISQIWWMTITFYKISIPNTASKDRIAPLKSQIDVEELEGVLRRISYSLTISNTATTILTRF